MSVSLLGHFQALIYKCLRNDTSRETRVTRGCLTWGGGGVSLQGADAAGPAQDNGGGDEAADGEPEEGRLCRELGGDPLPSELAVVGKVGVTAFGVMGKCHRGSCMEIDAVLHRTYKGKRVCFSLEHVVI